MVNFLSFIQFLNGFCHRFTFLVILHVLTSFIIRPPMALTLEKMSPRGIALFCLELSLCVSLPYIIAFSFGISLGITFSILFVMFHLIVSIRSSSFLYFIFAGKMAS